MTARTILVTGAAGFTGRHFIAAAREAGFECIATCRYETDRVPGAAEVIACDLLDKASVLKLLKHTKPYAVVHLAAISFIAHDDTAEIYQVNLIGTLNLLDAISAGAPDVKKILLASSANIYGNVDSLPINEQVPPSPINHYGVSKYSMEMASALYHQLPIVTLRPFNYTGVGQPEHFLIPKLVAAYRERRATISLGNLEVSRDFSDVRDVVTAYLRLVDVDGARGAYNICSGRSTSLASIIGTLEDLSGHEIDIRQDPALIRSHEIIELYGSSSRLEAAVGDYRRYELEDTLSWMLGE